MDLQPELLTFFKSLADPTRLRLAGLLAERPRAADELAAALDVRPIALQKHLARLLDAGLIEGPTGAAQTYRLRLDQIHATAGRLLAHEKTEVPPEAAAGDFEHKVLTEFLRPDGTIKDLPAAEKRFMVIVRYALRVFEPGRRYTEKEVNAALKALHPDSATLRRAMIDNRLLERVPNGGSIGGQWRTRHLPPDAKERARPTQFVAPALFLFFALFVPFAVKPLP
jgi:DNA-binding transcriptional ArsR family regulator